MTWQNEPSPASMDERDLEGAPHASTTVDGSVADGEGDVAAAAQPEPHRGEGVQARTPPSSD